MSKETDFTKLSEMNLVNIINYTEGIAWRINHDAADGRIEENVDSSIKELIEKRNEAIKVLQAKTGITKTDEMREYVQKMLRKQDSMWDRQWASIHLEGAVFKIKGGRRFSKDDEHLYETVRAYLPAQGVMGPKQYALARVQGTKYFRTFDDRDIPELVKIVDAKPMYNNISTRGIILANEEKEKRSKTRVPKSQIEQIWYKYDNAGAVFDHSGFNDTFETFEDFRLKTNTPVILARSYSRPVYVEFTPKELALMSFSKTKPRYSKRDAHGNVNSMPGITFDK